MNIFDPFPVLPSLQSHVGRPVDVPQLTLKSRSLFGDANESLTSTFLLITLYVCLFCTSPLTLVPTVNSITAYPLSLLLPCSIFVLCSLSCFHLQNPFHFKSRYAAYNLLQLSSLDFAVYFRVKSLTFLSCNKPAGVYIT